MRKDDRVRLQHMLDAAREAVEFVRLARRQDLDHDRKLTLALVKDIEIIGEAAYQISEATRQQLPQIPWDDIVGMRHRLVHAYFDINLDILWNTLQEDLPSLITILQPVLEGA
ncbi:DUF86 domain-containing protein [Roseiflexus sp.]|uniref:HepT-like ribonuclease domain-containing protein n=1 Tax=Roseiflexus sp. TaxID=2562120 RepID=UPI0021DF1AF1|nr:HepT-like ribonuclease domain-containing protein [Roseiflexus sp.]GIV99334.1 MAG: hypothetical protein KatS3mg058_0738 [Roseiflexus sp.]